jgi:carboxyl-terminal processing protease
MMIKPPVVILFALLVLITAGAQTADPDPAVRQALATRIYGLVQQHFVHWEGASRADVDAAYRKYLAAILVGGDRRQFDLATLRFIAALHNAHTQFFDDRADGRPLKFRLLEIENRWVVINSQDSALPRGAIVQTLNGQPVDDVVRELAQYVWASNERLARTHVFSYPVLFPERISVGLTTGKVVVIDRSVEPDAPSPAPSGQSDGWWLEEAKDAYLRIPSFGNPIFERTAVELVHRFASASTLIVDVRGNGGGTTPRQLIEALMNRPWQTWQQIAPAQPSREQAPSRSAYAGRLLILVNRFCGSACEDFVMPFKETHRAVVIGETTQGSSGNPYREDLGDGMRVAIGAVRYRFPDGRSFEGIGIEPDVPVELSIADLQSGRDTILQRARELATAK